MAKDVLTLNLYEVAKLIESKELSPVDLVRKLIKRIETVDPILNSYVTINKAQVISEAIRKEQEIMQGHYKGPLHGIPIGVKDNINTMNLKTTMGSAIFKNFVPSEDATVIDSLKKSGAIIIGKQNTHQFAYGPTGDRSYSGAVKNPYDTTKMTGGSSSGSAAAIAAGLAFGAVGTDTGGSVRIPASFCGIVGMKPTYGRVSKHGVFPTSWTLDHVGPLTRSVRDNALMLNVMARYDTHDVSSVDRSLEDFTRYIGRDINGKVIGIPSTFYYDHLDVEVAEKMGQIQKVLQELGAQIIPVELSNMEMIIESHRTLIRSDTYAIHENYLKQYPELYDEEVRERLFTGLNPKGYEYALALQIRQRAKQIFNEALKEVDVLVTPTMSILTVNINERYVHNDKTGAQSKSDNLHQKEEDHIRWTITKLSAPTNLNGFPSLSIPCGYSTEGMPIGIQFIAGEFEEAKLYQFGHALEQKLGLTTVKMDINNREK